MLNISCTFVGLLHNLGYQLTVDVSRCYWPPLDVRDITSLSNLASSSVLAAELEGTLMLKIYMTGYWLVWQYYESHVVCSVDQTSLPLSLFKINAFQFKNIGQDVTFCRINLCRQLMLSDVSDHQRMLETYL